MNKVQRQEIRALMFGIYKEIASDIFYIDHCENIEKYLDDSAVSDSDWKIQCLKALRDLYIEDPIGNKLLASPYNIKEVTHEDREVRRHLIQNICKFIEEKISEFNNVPLSANHKVGKLTIIEDPVKQNLKQSDYNLNLTDVFVNDSKYKYIMNLLVEKGYCQQDTFIWKDLNNGNKGLLASILKHFHSLGYLKNNSQLSTEMIKAIAKNTFGKELSIDTIKKAKPDKFNLKFIPTAENIN